MSDLGMHLDELGFEHRNVASDSKCVTRLTASTNAVCWIMIKFLSIFLDGIHCFLHPQSCTHTLSIILLSLCKTFRNFSRGFVWARVKESHLSFISFPYAL